MLCSGFTRAYNYVLNVSTGRLGSSVTETLADVRIWLKAGLCVARPDLTVRASSFYQPFYSCSRQLGDLFLFYLPAASLIFHCRSIPVYHLMLNRPTTKHFSCDCVHDPLVEKTRSMGIRRGRKGWPEVNGWWLHVVDDRHENWLLEKRLLNLSRFSRFCFSPLRLYNGQLLF